MSDSFDLTEGTDFILNALYNQNNDLQASVKCNCGRLITLTMKNGKIQLSNFQKHLRSTNCSHIKAIKKMNGAQIKNNLQQSTDTLSLSTSMTLKPSAPTQQQQQSASQVSAAVATGASLAMNIPSEGTQTVRSQTNSRKRGQSPSQLSSSQRTKRNRT
jgi:hypothetical protein